MSLVKELKEFLIKLEQSSEARLRHWTFEIEGIDFDHDEELLKQTTDKFGMFEEMGRLYEPDIFIKIYRFNNYDKYIAFHGHISSGNYDRWDIDQIFEVEPEVITITRFESPIYEGTMVYQND